MEGLSLSLHPIKANPGSDAVPYSSAEAAVVIGESLRSEPPNRLRQMACQYKGADCLGRQRRQQNSVAMMPGCDNQPVYLITPLLISDTAGKAKGLSG